MSNWRLRFTQRSTRTFCMLGAIWMGMGAVWLLCGGVYVATHVDGSQGVDWLVIGGVCVLGSVVAFLAALQRARREGRRERRAP